MSAVPHCPAQMDFVRLGVGIRALRRRRGWRQSDLAAAAGVSQELVSLIERGHGDRVAMRTIARVAAALDARVAVQLRWRAGDLDRLLDAGHAAVSSAMVDRLRRAGWEARVEVTYAIGRASGSVDILGWHTGTRSLLVIEIKTELASAEATFRKLDEKARLAARIAMDRFGWRAATVSRLLVIDDAPTNRRRIQSAAGLVDASLPVGGRAVAAWLRRPLDAIAGRLFLSPSNRGGTKQVRGGRERVRRTSQAPDPVGSRTAEPPRTDPNGSEDAPGTILLGYHHRGY